MTIFQEEYEIENRLDRTYRKSETFSCLSSWLKMDENAFVDGAVMVNFGWEFFIVLNTIIDLSNMYIRGEH
jgi:hypothetical protein